MYRLEPKDRVSFQKACLGLIDADLVLVNGKVVNVFTGEVLPANVFISQGFICHVEYEDLNDRRAKEVFDCHGKYIVPGFIDAHMHIESTMLTPRNFAKVGLIWGTTTIVTDPHEIGNVYGVVGVKYMHDSSADLPMRQFIDIPSCVPALPGKENSGADFTAPQINELAKLDRVIGLAEVMDFLAVIYGESRMNEILNAALENNLYIQGHAPGVTGRMLSAYVANGPYCDHETRDSFNAYEKIRAGMHIDARESSMCHDVQPIVKGVNHIKYKEYLSMCTDDIESDDLLRKGHLNRTMQLAIDQGLDPVDCIKCATLNNAHEIKVDHLGAIAPGYTADINLLDDLKVIKPSHTFYMGQLVAKDQQLLVNIPDKQYAIEQQNSVVVKDDISVDDFTLKVELDNGYVTCNVMTYDDLDGSLTHLEKIQCKVVDHKIVLEDDSIKFLAIVNRYQGNNNIALNLVKNFGLSHGAIASTVSHDSHNLTIVYDKPENALAATKHMVEIKGGMVATDNGQVLNDLSLPLAGLMSLQTADKVSERATSMKETYRTLGLTVQTNPLLRIVTLALPVVPQYKMSDLGLIEVATKNIIPLVD